MSIEKKLGYKKVSSKPVENRKDIPKDTDNTGGSCN